MKRLGGLHIGTRIACFSSGITESPSNLHILQSVIIPSGEQKNKRNCEYRGLKEVLSEAHERMDALKK
jgi:hypothetical protein